MSKRRKHRVMCEVTFDKPVTAKQAAWFMKYVAMSEGLTGPKNEVAVKCTFKEGERVIRAEIKMALEKLGLFVKRNNLT